jgi:hypothetical protein
MTSYFGILRLICHAHTLQLLFPRSHRYAELLTRGRGGGYKTKENARQPNQIKTSLESSVCVWWGFILHAGLGSYVQTTSLFQTMSSRFFNSFKILNHAGIYEKVVEDSGELQPLARFHLNWLLSFRLERYLLQVSSQMQRKVRTPSSSTSAPCHLLCNFFQLPAQVH